MLNGISNVNSYLKNEEAARKMTQKLYEGQNSLNSKKASSASSNNSRINSIKRKMRMGKKLSGSEKAFLRKAAPQLYQKAVKAEKVRNDLEHKIKNCKSKDEFNRLRAQITQYAVDVGDITLNCQANFSEINSTAIVGLDNSAAVNADIAQQNIDANTVSSVSEPAINNEENSNSNNNIFETDNTNYTYNALNNAYGSYKQSLSYSKLPQSSKHKKPHRINIKA